MHTQNDLETNKCNKTTHKSSVLETVDMVLKIHVWDHSIWDGVEWRAQKNSSLYDFCSVCVFREREEEEDTTPIPQHVRREEGEGKQICLCLVVLPLSSLWIATFLYPKFPTLTTNGFRPFCTSHCTEHRLACHPNPRHTHTWIICELVDVCVRLT